MLKFHLETKKESSEKRTLIKISIESQTEGIKGQRTYLGRLGGIPGGNSGSFPGPTIHLSMRQFSCIVHLHHPKEMSSDVSTIEGELCCIFTMRKTLIWTYSVSNCS